MRTVDRISIILDKKGQIVIKSNKKSHKMIEELKEKGKEFFTDVYPKPKPEYIVIKGMNK